MVLAVISDTHMPRDRRRLPDACLARLREADAILHAGDLIDEAVLDELARARAARARRPRQRRRPRVRLLLPAARMVEPAARASG